MSKVHTISGGEIRKRSSGFSLIELVIVVVIIAIIGAIAIPKMSRGAAGAGDSALIQDLSVLRSALDAYQAENVAGAYPPGDTVTNALLQYNDGNGGISATQDSTHIYGPYLRAVPPIPVGAHKGSNGISVADGVGIGWIYAPATGRMSSNTTTETDGTGALYSGY